MKERIDHLDFIKIKNCSVEMQIKTTMRYHYTAVRMGAIQKYKQ